MCMRNTKLKLLYFSSTTEPTFNFPDISLVFGSENNILHFKTSPGKQTTFPIFNLLPPSAPRKHRRTSDCQSNIKVLALLSYYPIHFSFMAILKGKFGAYQPTGYHDLTFQNGHTTKVLTSYL